MNILNNSLTENRLALVNPEFYPPVLNKLGNRHLPVLPHGAQELLSKLNDEKADFEQVAQFLEHFPTIVARLISLANSAWSAPRAEITSLSMACSRLGLNVVRSTSIALAVAAPFNLLHCPLFDARKYWTSAFCCAEISYKLARLSAGYENPQTARACGLLHNLGLLWLADQLPVLTQQSIQRCKTDQNISLDQSLSEIIGAGYTQAGGYLATLWELPEVFEQTMAFHRTTESQPQLFPETSIVAGSIKLFKMIDAEINAKEAGAEKPAETTEPLEQVQQEEVQQIATSLQIDLSALQALITQIPQDMERCSALANTLFGQ
jgi:HD-like signal output (HDOD) protein